MLALLLHIIEWIAKDSWLYIKIHFWRKNVTEKHVQRKGNNVKFPNGEIRIFFFDDGYQIAIVFTSINIFQNNNFISKKF